MILVIVITSFHRFPNYMRTGTPWTEETLQPFEIGCDLHREKHLSVPSPSHVPRTRALPQSLISRI